FPLAVGSAAGLLASAAAEASSPALDLVLGSTSHVLPPGADGDPATDRAILEAAASVVAECLADPAVAAAVDRAIAEVNDDPDALHAVLDAQHYRLARWQIGADEVAYRRFFDVTELVAVRVERP